MIVGDLHLGGGLSMGKPGIGTALNSRLADQVNLLDWLVNQAIDHNVDTMIFTGDICEDVKPDYILVNIFFQFLKKCEIYNLDIHIIAGNHDIKRTGFHYTSILDLINTWEFENCHVHKQLNTIYKDGVCFTLMPFRDRRSFNCDSNAKALDILANQLPYEVSDISPGNDRVLIGHLAIEGSLPVGNEFDDFSNELMCPLSMFSEYDYVWMGHIHRPQIRSKKPYIAHIGSLDISDFGETDHQKIIVIYNSSKENKFIEIPVPSRPLIKIEIAIPANIDSTAYMLEQLTDMQKNKPFKDAIVKIEVKLLGQDSANVNRETIESFLSSCNVHYICNFSESRKLTVVPIAKQQLIDSTIQPKTAIKLYADQLKFESEDLKNSYVELANNLIEKYQASINK